MLGLGQGLQKVSNTLSNVIRELREHWNTNTTFWQESNNKLVIMVLLIVQHKHLQMVQEIILD